MYRTHAPGYVVVVQWAAGALAARILAVPLTIPGLLGVIVAAQHAGRASSLLWAGSVAGLFVGSTARWSGDGQVTARDALAVATAAIAVHVVPIGSSTLGAGALWAAIIGLTAWWWLSGTPALDGTHPAAPKPAHR